MALHDIDKISDDRSSPSPNKHDQLPADTVMGKNTQSTTHINSNTSTTTTRIQMLNQQLLGFDSSNTARLLFGLDSEGNMAIKGSKQGVDVRTADNLQLNFNSLQDTFKIVTKATSSIPAFTLNSSGAGSSLLTYAHNQTTTPIVQVYAQAQMVNYSTSSLLAVSYVPLPIHASSYTTNVYYFPDSTDTYLVQADIIFGVDATNIYVQIAVNAGSGYSGKTIAAIPVALFILQETAT